MDDPLFGLQVRLCFDVLCARERLELRSDPYIKALEVTNGTFDFGFKPVTEPWRPVSAKICAQILENLGTPRFICGLLYKWGGICFRVDEIYVSYGERDAFNGGHPPNTYRWVGVGMFQPLSGHPSGYRKKAPSLCSKPKGLHPGFCWTPYLDTLSLSFLEGSHFWLDSNAPVWVSPRHVRSRSWPLAAF